MGAVAQLCTRVGLLSAGKLAMIGQPSDVIGEYVRCAGAGGGGEDERWERTGSGKLRVRSVEVSGADGEPGRAFQMGSSVEIRIGVEAVAEAGLFSVAVQFVNYAGVPVVWSYDERRTFEVHRGNTFAARIVFPEMDLLPGVYFINVWLGRSGIEEFDYVRFAATFDVVQGGWTPVTTPIDQRLGFVYKNLEVQLLS
jgi:hypothetical protein